MGGALNYVFQVFDRDCELISSNWNWSDEIRNGKPEAIGSKEGPTNNCEDGILVTITDNTFSQIQFMYKITIHDHVEAFTDFACFYTYDILTKDTSRNNCRVLYPYNCRNILFIIRSYLCST